MNIVKFCFLIVFLIVFTLFVSGQTWTSSGEFSEGNVFFYFDDDGIWNLSGDGTTAFLINALNINISGIYYGNGSGLTDVSVSVADIWVNESGDSMSGTLNMSGNTLTDVGELVMTGLTLARDVVPVTTGLYSLGNSSNVWGSLYVNNIFATNISTSFLNSDVVNSSTINTGNIAVDSNITLGGFRIEKDGNDLVVVLT